MAAPRARRPPTPLPRLAADAPAAAGAGPGATAVLPPQAGGRPAGRVDLHARHRPPGHAHQRCYLQISTRPEDLDETVCSLKFLAERVGRGSWGRPGLQGPAWDAPSPSSTRHTTLLGTPAPCYCRCPQPSKPRPRQRPSSAPGTTGRPAFLVLPKEPGSHLCGQRQQNPYSLMTSLTSGGRYPRRWEPTLPLPPWRSALPGVIITPPPTRLPLSPSAVIICTAGDPRATEADRGQVVTRSCTISSDLR